MPMVLTPLDGGRPVPLDKAILFFGRGPECDVILNTSRKVSRKHCCVAQIDDFYVVRDLGSMNGLRVNDQTVNGEMRLNVGDELWIGDVGFRLQILGGHPASQRPATNAPPANSPATPVDRAPLPLSDDEVGLEEEASDRQVRRIPDAELRGLSDDDADMI